MKLRKVYGKFGKPDRFYIDHREVDEAEFEAVCEAERPKYDVSSGDGNRPWSKPIQSDALAVHPKQIKAVMDRNARHGLHIDYNGEDGRPILKDRDQRKRLIQVEREHAIPKLVDHDGGYGDG